MKLRALVALLALAGLGCPKHSSQQAPPPEETPPPADESPWKLDHSYPRQPTGSVTPAKDVYGPLDKIAARVRCDDCGPTSCLRIVPAGTPLPEADQLDRIGGVGDWLYGLDTGGALRTGTVDVESDNPGPGQWEFWLIHGDTDLSSGLYGDVEAEDGSGTVPAESRLFASPFTVSDVMPSGTLEVSPDNVGHMDPMQVTIRCQLCTKSTWLGIFRPGTWDERWRVEPSKVYAEKAVVVGPGSQTVEVFADLSGGGRWEIRLFYGEGMGKKLASAWFNVIDLPDSPGAGPPEPRGPSALEREFVGLLDDVLDEWLVFDELAAQIWTLIAAIPRGTPDEAIAWMGSADRKATVVLDGVFAARERVARARKVWAKGRCPKGLLALDQLDGILAGVEFEADLAATHIPPVSIDSKGIVSGAVSRMVGQGAAVATRIQTLFDAAPECL
jgi:hypothetical protein